MHAVLAAVVAICFVATFVINTTGAEDPNTGLPVPPVPASVWLVRMFSYFTVQSNLLIGIAAATLARTADSGGSCASTPCSAS